MGCWTMEKQVHGKKEAIIGAALKLFTERGFYGTSTAQISREAGVATGTLFNYFSTKEDLINDLYYEVKGNLSQSLREGLGDESSFQAKIKRMWSNLIDWGVSNPQEFLFTEHFCSSPYISKLTRDEVLKEYTFFRDVVREGMEEGQMKEFPQDLIMSILFDSGKTVVRLILNSPGTQDKEQLIENSFQLIWGGLAKE